MANIVQYATNQLSGASQVTANFGATTDSGSYIIVFVMMDDASQTLNTPSGYTQIVASSNSVKTGLYYRTGAAVSSVTVTRTGGGNPGWSILIVEVEDVKDLEAYNGIATGFTTTWDPQGLTTAEPSLILAAAVIHGNDSDYTVPSGYTAEINSGTQWQRFFSKSQSSAGAEDPTATGLLSKRRGHLIVALSHNNTSPDTPTDLTVTSTGTDTTPNFSAGVSDPDSAQQIKARFEIETAAGASVGSVDSTLTGGAHTATAEYASALALGNYRVRAKTIDDAGAESSYTDYVSFSIRQAVAAPDLNLLWQVGILVGPDLNLLWDVFQSGQKDLGLLWDVYEDVFEDLELLWSQKTPWDTVTNPASTWVKVDD